MAIHSLQATGYPAITVREVVMPGLSPSFNLLLHPLAYEMMSNYLVAGGEGQRMASAALWWESRTATATRGLLRHPS